MDIDTEDNLLESVNITAFYLNHIGVLNIKIEFTNDFLAKTNLKVFQSCIDGELLLKIKFFDKFTEIKVNTKENYYIRFGIKIPSMKINFKDSILSIVNSNNIVIKYYSSKNLCNSIINEKCIVPTENLKKIKNINCKECSSLIYFNNMPLYDMTIKGIYKFNYDYIDSMDILSCHESHNNFKIDDSKLLSVINAREFTISIYQNINEITDNQACLNSLSIKPFDNAYDKKYIKCTNCSHIIGYYDSYSINTLPREYISLWLNAIVINDYMIQIEDLLKYYIKILLVNLESNTYGKITIKNSNFSKTIILESSVNFYHILKFQCMINSLTDKPNADTYSNFESYYLVKYNYSESECNNLEENVILSDRDFDLLIKMIENNITYSSQIINDFIMPDLKEKTEENNKEQVFLISL